MDCEQIAYEIEDHILTIILNRPEKLNAFTNQMRDELIDAIDSADADDNVRAIIITGAGRGFCAGKDLSGGGDTFNYEADGDQIRRDGGGRLTLRLFECLKPIIAACNGPAAGIGATMQCAMNVGLASESALYGFVFSKHGLATKPARVGSCPD